MHAEPFLTVYAEHCQGLAGQLVPSDVIDPEHPSDDHVTTEVSLEAYRYYQGLRSHYGWRVAGQIGDALGFPDYQEAVQVLGVITTRTDAGEHFTQRYDDVLLAALEEYGWITIRRPVHEATGLPYDSQYWSLEVTADGQAVVDRDFIPED